MLRPNGWLVGFVVIALVLVFVVRPEARTPERGVALSVFPVAPTAQIFLGGCATIAEREDYERIDCLQAARIDLIEGWIDLAQAIERLESCTWERQDLAGLGDRQARLRADLFRARMAFGQELDAEELAEYESLREELELSLSPPAPEAVERLRAAGITADGLEPRQASAIIARLAAGTQLRRDFRTVFGDRRADELEALLGPDRDRESLALVLGSTAIIPNRAAAYPTAEGAIAYEDADALRPVAVNAEAYGARVTADLRTLEASRRRYLSSAAQENQRVGSINVFLSSLRSFGKEDEEGLALRTQVEHDRAVLAARLINLDRRLGVDPLVSRMAGESVGLAHTVSTACAGDALDRQRLIRTGAGVVTGLVGAAGLVVATGTTGTMIGGLTIAAALEATVGAYLIARSERLDGSGPTALRSAPGASEMVDERQFRRPDGEWELQDGTEGTGGGVHDTWFEDLGDLREWASLEGEGIEEEADEWTDPGPRENRIAPILPVDLPESLRELPPLLDALELRELRDLTLPEILERLDEFLAVSDHRDPLILPEAEDSEVWSLEQMIEEARTSLRLWETDRILSDRFGAFFIRAELEKLPVSRRPEVLVRAMSRYLTDQRVYAGSADLGDLRNRMSLRIVTHCRAGTPQGDLVLTACTDETARSILLVAALRDAGINVSGGSVLGVQVFGSRFEAVLYDRTGNQVFSLTRGTTMEGVVAPIYHPATFYFGYLVGHGTMPAIDVDRHLLIALPDRPMPLEMALEDCEDEEKRSILGRAVDFLGSMVGIRRIGRSDPCAELREIARSEALASRQDESEINISVPGLRNPLQRGGGGEPGGGQTGVGAGGGGQGGGGAGGGMSMPGAAAPEDPTGGGTSGGRGDSGGDGRSGQGTEGSAAAGDGQGEGPGGEGNDSGQGLGEMAGVTSDSGGESSGAGGTGGYGVGNVATGPNLTNIGRETVRLAQHYDRTPGLRIMPWRLRDDEGMMTGSPNSVLYADNQRALDRFDADDIFMTLTPAEVEAQRRMLAADSFPIFSAETECGMPDLPPRRVFRRVATGDPGFRYVYCDQQESMVIFRERRHAEEYSRLAPPDRPIYLARHSTERIARFERSDDIQRLNAFLTDPNVLRDYDKDQIYGMSKAAADLLVFQNALESALVQSMNELGQSGARHVYFEYHRVVLQSPFFIQMAENVHRLNQRLASDPLQSLAWANAQPTLARQGFFDLYHTVGRMMEWPERWNTLQRRYGSASSPPVAMDPSAPTLDFLQILSDPVRVQVDWRAERDGNPSIRDRQIRDGIERTPEDRTDPSLAEEVERQDERERQRGGTGGLGQAGEGDSVGPERGRRPLQMIFVRIVPDTGDPDRERLPDDNQVRPGGTEGEKRTQTEESASRQEPLLWVSPQTFVEAVLSTWDGRNLQPETAGRIPPLLRFNERLREVFLRDLRPEGVYDNRLRTAMEVFTSSGWLRYAEVREAMGGSMANVRARDTGRFSAAYSGNAPINDQDQIRIPNFFTSTGVVIPADLFEPVREHYHRSILQIFDLTRDGRVPIAVPLRGLPVQPGDASTRARENLLRTLEIIRQQSLEAD